MFLICSTIVHAAKPTPQTSVTAGQLEIVYPKHDFYQISKNMSLNFHVFNSTGSPVNGTRGICKIHIYKPDGTHFIQGATLTVDGPDYRFRLTSKNITYFGRWPYIVYCQSIPVTGKTGMGGYVSTYFNVVTNPEFDSYMADVNSNYDLVLIFGFVLLGFFLLYFSSHFKFDSPTFGKAILSFSMNLLLKLMAFSSVFYSLLFLRQVLPSVTNLYTTFDLFLRVFFYSLGVIFFIIYFVYAFLNIVESFKLNKILNKEKKEREY